MAKLLISAICINIFTSIVCGTLWLREVFAFPLLDFPRLSNDLCLYNSANALTFSFSGYDQEYDLGISIHALKFGNVKHVQNLLLTLDGAS